MSKYTTRLVDLKMYFEESTIKSWFSNYELSDYLTDDEIAVITTRGTWTKEKLANEIYENYIDREIGYETPELFKIHVKNKMRKIMEEKLPLIYSASIEYDPLVNVDYTETYDGGNTANGSSTSNQTSNASGLTINNDTPQGEINKTNILNGTYASSTQGGESTNTTNDTVTTSNTDINHYTKSIKGNSGVSATAQAMIKQYRQNIRAINKEIIEEMNSQFMGLY